MTRDYHLTALALLLATLAACASPTSHVGLAALSGSQRPSFVQDCDPGIGPMSMRTASADRLNIFYADVSKLTRPTRADLVLDVGPAASGYLRPTSSPSATLAIKMRGKRRIEFRFSVSPDTQSVQVRWMQTKWWFGMAGESGDWTMTADTSGYVADQGIDQVAVKSEMDGVSRVELQFDGVPIEFFIADEN